MDVLQAAVLGMVQGLTEFIPISSTAHLRIVPALLGWADPGAAFSAVIQLGTLAAMVVYFAGDIHRFGLSAVMMFGSKDPQVRQDGRLAWMIAAGNLPIIVLGLSFKHQIEHEARSLMLIGFMLVAVALLLLLAERMARQTRTWESLGWGWVMVVGLFQALALIPGASRSGATILGGLWAGLRRDDAARFSFLLGIPAIFGAGVFELKDLVKAWPANGQGELLPLLVGLGTAAVFGYLSIEFLLRYLRTRTTLVFVAYRLVVGTALMVLAWKGLLQ